MLERFKELVTTPARDLTIKDDFELRCIALTALVVVLVVVAGVSVLWERRKK